MSVSKKIIKSQITVLLKSTAVESIDIAQDKFADQLSDIIYNAIVSATVTIAAGIPVTTVGSATTQTGATTATGTGALT